MRVFIDRMDEGCVGEAVSRALDWLDLGRFVPDGARVYLKPNLTWPEHLPGVTTSPAFIAAVAEAFLRRTPNVTIVESDGGYHSFEAEEAFRGHGLYDLAERLGVGLLNLSKLPCEQATTTVAGRTVAVELPSVLLHDSDVFVTLPVPKVHAMTRVSLGFKNQWGCLPTTMRLRNHPEFPYKIVAVNKLLRVRLAVFDGAHFLDRSGPMIGVPVPMNLIVASDDVGAGTLAVCRLMGFDPAKAPHLRIAQREGLLPRSLDEVELNQDVGPFCTRRFTLRRTPINWIALGAFRSRTGTRILYDSRTADRLHRVLYAIRRNRVIGRFLYGSVGPPAAEGGRSRPHRSPH